MMFKSFKPTSNGVGFIKPVVLCRGRGLLSGQLCRAQNWAHSFRDECMRDPNNRTPTRGAFRPKHSGALLFGYLISWACKRK